MVRDILRIIMINKKNNEMIFKSINKVGIKKENKDKILKLNNKLKNTPDVHLKFDGAVIFYKHISPGCEHCVVDMGCTIRPSIQCNRNCFFCFVDDSPITKKIKPDLVSIKKIIKNRFKEEKFQSFAISGGEPFLYPEEVFEILRFVNNEFGSSVYTRVYTNGDLVNENILIKLKELKLNEIRFSVKPLEEPKTSLLKCAKRYIPTVLIEMPVLPNSEKFMKKLILKLDKIGIDGINLLELFYNGHNSEIFKKRHYKIDITESEIRKIYNSKPVFEYPIYGSRALCLKLLKYFSDAKLGMFINFCSQKTKQLQYDRRQKKVASENMTPFSIITPVSTHEVLAIYSDLEMIEKKLKNLGIKEYLVRKDKNISLRIETSVTNIGIFRKENISLVKLYRDPSNTYDIGFKVIKIKKNKDINTNVSELIDNFKKYV
ncbi:MAG: radical SAM protein [Patescibacteria group bacterium]|jgi:pyruvate formate-lyase activating enzyme-like uncharacterized protein